MKRFLTTLFLLVFLSYTFVCNASVKYKGFFNFGGTFTTGDTYKYVMGCDKKIGWTLNTEQGILFDIIDDHPTRIFFGGGIGYDRVSVSLDSFDPNELETKNVLSNTVSALPLYLTFKYIPHISLISMSYALRGGYYKWFRGKYVNEDASQKDYRVPYQGGFTVGASIGLRFPINDRFKENKYGISLMFNYDYVGANTKWQNQNIKNHKLGISIGFDY